MGYYREYSLTWKIGDAADLPQCNHEIPPLASFCPTCGKAIQKHSIVDGIGDYIDADEYMSYAMHRNGNPREQYKWYKYRNDMIKMSKEFPGTLFVLHGIGEEFPDIWAEHFINGKFQHIEAEITYAAFDIEKLE